MTYGGGNRPRRPTRLRSGACGDGVIVGTTLAGKLRPAGWTLPRRCSGDGFLHHAGAVAGPSIIFACQIRGQILATAQLRSLVYTRLGARHVSGS